MGLFGVFNKPLFGTKPRPLVTDPAEVEAVRREAEAFANVRLIGVQVGFVVGGAIGAIVFVVSMLSSVGGGALPIAGALRPIAPSTLSDAVIAAACTGACWIFGPHLFRWFAARRKRWTMTAARYRASAEASAKFGITIMSIIPIAALALGWMTTGGPVGWMETLIVASFTACIAGGVVLGLALRHRDGRELHCSKCHYPAADDAVLRCPECGRDLAKPLARILGRPRVHRGRLIGGVALLVIGAAALLTIGLV